MHHLPFRIRYCAGSVRRSDSAPSPVNNTCIPRKFVLHLSTMHASAFAWHCTTRGPVSAFWRSAASTGVQTCKKTVQENNVVHFACVYFILITTPVYFCPRSIKTYRRCAAGRDPCSARLRITPHTTSRSALPPTIANTRQSVWSCQRTYCQASKFVIRRSCWECSARLSMVL